MPKMVILLISCYIIGSINSLVCAEAMTSIFLYHLREGFFSPSPKLEISLLFLLLISCILVFPISLLWSTCCLDILVFFWFSIWMGMFYAFLWLLSNWILIWSLCRLPPLQLRVICPLHIPSDWVWLWISQSSIMRSWIHLRGCKLLFSVWNMEICYDFLFYMEVAFGFVFQGLPPCKVSFWWSYLRAWHPQWGVIQR